MEEKYYEILRHYVNPNDCATVVKQLLSLHNVVWQSEQLKPLPPNECEQCGVLIDHRLNECGDCGL